MLSQDEIKVAMEVAKMPDETRATLISSTDVTKRIGIFAIFAKVDKTRKGGTPQSAIHAHRACATPVEGEADATPTEGDAGAVDDKAPQQGASKQPPPRNFLVVDGEPRSYVEGSVKMLDEKKFQAVLDGDSDPTELLFKEVGRETATHIATKHSFDGVVASLEALKMLGINNFGLAVLMHSSREPVRRVG